MQYLNQSFSAHPVGKHNVVACALGPTGEFAYIPRQYSSVLGHPLHKRLHSLGVHLVTIPCLALLLAITLTWGVCGRGNSFTNRVSVCMCSSFSLYTIVYFCMWSIYICARSDDSVVEEMELTGRRAGRDTAGPVDGPLARAVAAAVTGGGVVALAVCKLHSTPTCARALAPGPPWAPASMVWDLKEEKNSRKTVMLYFSQRGARLLSHKGLAGGALLSYPWIWSLI